jgi:phosphoribosylanthranilate isomerase
MATKVKVCGITNVADGLAAADVGADAIGLNFAGGPRLVDQGVAREIVAALPPFVTPVALFVDAQAAWIRQICTVCGITTVQLHGDEPPDLLANLSPLCVIKAFRVGAEDDLAGVAAFCDACAEDGRPAAILLDARVPGKRGGTGHTFDWNLALHAKPIGPVVLAGGLGPENVAEAIRLVQPYAVDACSKLESEPGRKDRARMADFVAAAHAAGAERGSGAVCL